jgi:hypothetical protein
VRAEWLGPAAVLTGAAAVCVSVVYGAARVATAIEQRAPAAPASGVPLPASPNLAPAAAPASVTSAAPPAPDGGVLELPIVTYDSFERRFAGPLAAEAEARCWKPAAELGPADEVIYLYLDVSVDGRVERAVVERRPPLAAPPPKAHIEALGRCVAEVARKVVFMRLPEPVSSARVAAHRPKR